MENTGVGPARDHYDDDRPGEAVRLESSLLREIAELDEQLTAIAQAVDIAYERCDAVLRRPPMEALLAERVDATPASVDSHAVNRIRQLQEMASGIHQRLDEFVGRVQL